MSGQAELPQSHKNPKAALLGWRNTGRNKGSNTGSPYPGGALAQQLRILRGPWSGGSTAQRNSCPDIPA